MSLLYCLDDLSPLSLDNSIGGWQALATTGCYTIGLLLLLLLLLLLYSGWAGHVSRTKEGRNVLKIITYNRTGKTLQH